MEQQLRALLRAGSAVTVPGGQVHSDGFTLAPGQRVTGHLLVLQGDAELAGTIAGNVVVFDGNLILRPGGTVTGDALVIGGRAIDAGGRIAGELRATAGARALSGPAPAAAASIPARLAGLVGVTIALLLSGFGLVTFARERLEVVSDTVNRSFVRSFLVGLLAQVVALPTAGLLVAGLIISIVGILLLPFVAVVIPLLFLAAVLVGFLGAMHAVGEARIRRRMAAGELVGSPNSYRYLLLGLGGLSLIWLAWIGFGWVPVAGTVVLLVALVVTWVAGTAGLGAFLLSRGGLRTDAAGRFLPPEAMTDEYLWATPRYGVTAARRPRP